MTLVTMAPPVALSLLLLARREAWAGARREALQRARAAVLQQCALLDEGTPLTMPVSALAVRAPRPHRLEEGLVTLEYRTSTGLQVCYREGKGPCRPCANTPPNKPAQQGCHARSMFTKYTVNTSTRSPGSAGTW